MTKYILMIHFLLLFSQMSLAQKTKREITLSIDAAGVGAPLSLNTEIEFCRKDSTKYSTRLGFGAGFLWNQGIISVPIGVNATRSFSRFQLDFGLGLTYFIGLSSIDDQLSYANEEAIYFIPNIGLRLNKIDEDIIIKIYYAPLFPVVDLLNEDKYINSRMGAIEYNSRPLEFQSFSKKEYYYQLGNETPPAPEIRLGWFGVALAYTINRH
jgi:hypothetical protein